MQLQLHTASNADQFPRILAEAKLYERLVGLAQIGQVDVSYVESQLAEIARPDPAEYQRAHSTAGFWAVDRLEGARSALAEFFPTAEIILEGETFTLAEFAELARVTTLTGRAARVRVGDERGRYVRDLAGESQITIERPDGTQVTVGRPARGAEYTHTALPDPSSVSDPVEAEEICAARAAASAYLGGYPDSRHARAYGYYTGVRGTWR